MFMNSKQRYDRRSKDPIKKKNLDSKNRKLLDIALRLIL